ncbi:MAG: hypothetical protein M9888_06360 [Chitinophagales bacterium]|nr:hypothetical protein [Chitinophagales bacterium]
MRKHNGIRPHDIVILSKIAVVSNEDWYLKDIANELFISNSEVSESIKRSVYSGLLSNSKRLMKESFLEYVIYGLKYTFPQRPMMIQRGMATSYSAHPMDKLVDSNEIVVWPFVDGKSRGLGIEPLHPNVPKACLLDNRLYEFLSLIEVLRTGNLRENKLAIAELKKRLQ